ncbi:MAG: hypothetical protein HUU57_13425 [Bdellovibrio sp.]|nr:hypothetical protein [Bdellovibrio sp.]
MTMNPLPPQAYTKDSLLKAYQWLMLQNSSIKEMATTPDILVSLYLKATRDGDSALDRPSIMNFKNELKSLAGMMGELDRQPHTSQPGSGTPVYTAPVIMPAPAPQQQTHVHTPQTSMATQQTQVSYTEKTMTATTRTQDVLELLDPCTLTMIREVKEEFNLSADLEALRMLVKIGHGRALGFIK